MFKKSFSLLLTVMSLSIAISANAHNGAKSNSSYSMPNRTEEKYDIMEEDETEDTDIFAIPLDSSEEEDQEELDRLKGKKYHPTAPNRAPQR